MLHDPTKKSSVLISKNRLYENVNETCYTKKYIETEIDGGVTAVAKLKLKVKHILLMIFFWKVFSSVGTTTGGVLCKYNDLFFCKCLVIMRFHAFTYIFRTTFKFTFVESRCNFVFKNTKTRLVKIHICANTKLLLRKLLYFVTKKLSRRYYVPDVKYECFDYKNNLKV